MIHSFIIGRLGADAELKTSKGGNQFLSMRVASNEYVNGENTTTWVTVIWSGDRAVKMAQYMKKGSLISINGTLRVSSYTSKNGEAGVNIDVFADRIDFLNTGTSGQTQTSEATIETGTLKKQEEVAVAETPSTEASFADDLPF